MSLSIQYVSTTIKEGNESETEKHSFKNALQKAIKTVFSIQHKISSKEEF
jgi:flagellar hook-basal body complex protein FliE